jgi:UPF0755 protein
LIIVSLLYYFATPVEVPEVVEVPKGGTQRIIAHLKPQGIGLSELDIAVARWFGYVQSGYLDMQGGGWMSHLDLLRLLTKAKAAQFQVTITPGETTEIFLQDVSKRYNFDYQKLRRAYDALAPYPDGVFLAQTYALPKGSGEKGFMKNLLDRSLRRHAELAGKAGLSQKEWFERIVTIASIIQKEAANRGEMPLVAAVIYNRLKKDMPLQMDGTLNYGRYSHVRVTPRRIRTDKSPFNTYLHKGLPPYPVCIVEEAAIDAALHPAKADYLYFVRGSDGGHIFAKSYKEHLHNIKNVPKRNKTQKSAAPKRQLSKDQ